MHSSWSSGSEDGTDTSGLESMSKKTGVEFKHVRKRVLKRKNRRMGHSGRQSSSSKREEICTTSPDILQESNKEKEDNTSSGKEFQTSKLSKNCYPPLKKLSRLRRYRASSSSKRNKMETMLNREQSLLFKTYMNQALNKFKETCSGFELHMEHVNWRHFRKNLTYRKNANKVINKYRNVIARLKRELDMQEKDLVNFYQRWNRKCDFGSIDETSEVETDSRNEKPKRLRDESVVSECDSEEIFSANERIANNAESRDVVSPILGKAGERKDTTRLKKRKVYVPLQKTEKLKELMVKSRDTVDSAHDRVENENQRTTEVGTFSTNITNKNNTEEDEEEVTPSEKLSNRNELEDEEWIDYSFPNSNKKAPLTEQRITEDDVSRIKEMVGQQQKDRIAANNSTDTESDSPTLSMLESDSECQAAKESIAENEIHLENTHLGENIPVDNESVALTMLESNSELQPAKDSIPEKETREINETKVMEDQRKQNHHAANTCIKKEPVTLTMLNSDLEYQLADECITEKEVNAMKKIQVYQEEDYGEVVEERVKSKRLESNLESQLANRCVSDRGRDKMRKTGSPREKNSAETNIFADEDWIKRALLESDSESLMADEPISGIVKNRTGGTEVSRNEEDAVEHAPIHKVNLSDVEQINGERDTTAKCTDSNSDDYPSSASNTRPNYDLDDDNENIRAKATLLMSSNSEASNSENTKSLSAESSFFVVKPNPNDRKNALTRKNTRELYSSVADRVKKRRISFQAKNTLDTDAKLMKPCSIVLETLPNWLLEKHARALQRSRQHLDYKAIKNLIDLDKLERNNKNAHFQNSKSLNKKTGKEADYTLLDYLNKIQNGEHMVINDEESDSEDENIFTKNQPTIQSNEELLAEADRAIKTAILNSSESDIEEMSAASETNEAKDVSNKTSKKVQPTPEKLNSSSKKDKEDERRENKWRQDKLLTKKFWDLEYDDEKKSRKKSQDMLNDKTEKSDIENCDINTVLTKKRNRKMLDSDTDIECLNTNSDTDDSVRVEYVTVSKNLNLKKKHRKRLKHVISSDSDSLFEKKRKPNTETNCESDSDNDEVSNSQGSPGKGGRKNIRKVMEDKRIASGTKQAAKEEEERIKRIAERQKLYNESYEARLAGEEKVEKLVLDFNPETKQELISVHEKLVHRLKPHQAKGIKFMWDACFETLERTKASTGSGCILAHCMGLGKTLQVIALVHTLLNHNDPCVKTAMVVCPLSTAHNWLSEFKVWLKNVDNRHRNLYELSKFKQNKERSYQLQLWQRTGGVLIIGYDMFRNLTGPSKNKNASEKERILKCLISPGPDLVVCDEGHLLKNEDTALGKSMKRIRTLRRIILTGTPLQNNLLEYHCMLQFVKPNLLGSRKEFLNRFVNPITNGQFDNSTEGDVKLMKKRAYVLHKMLKGCVQRFDYSVLTPFLPPKQEYVIFVSLTEVQVKLYQHYLDNFAGQGGLGGRLFADFQALQRVCTHPYVLRLNSEKTEKMNEKRMNDTEGSLKNFINNGGALRSSNSSGDDDVQYIHDNRDKLVIFKDNTKNKVSVEAEEGAKDDDWWLQYIQPEQFEDIRISAKLLLLFGILEESMQIGDKILIFSQSLYSLTLIEKFLKMIHEGTKSGTPSQYIDGHKGNWSLGLDYFRLDGQTTSENRSRWCRIFNTPTNIRARLFLISTRAGGLGINLTAANRVIIFDASWNPSHDVQSIFRIYRFGQKKPCYVYRFLAAGTMEETIYNRQVTKLSLSCRVVDEQQIERHYSNHSLSEFYRFNPNLSGQRPTLNLPKDRVLAEILRKYKEYVENYHEHDSLLENKADEELNEEERKQAWLEYETERMGNPVQLAGAIQPLPEIINLERPAMTYDIARNYCPPGGIISMDYQKALTDMYKNWNTPTTSSNQLHFRNIASRPQQPISMTTTHLNNNATSEQLKVLLPNIPNSHDLNLQPRGISAREIIEILPNTTNTITLPPQSLLKSNAKPKSQEE